MAHAIPAPRAPRERLVAPGQIDHHVGDMTATAAADVTLGDYQARLLEKDQWFPIDGDPKLPLGRLAERNSTGPLRLGYGAWRDLLLGAQFTNGDGELITAGGRTVKNVAGYDLTKFMIGQSGVFGRLATLTTRTYRKPDGALLARFKPVHSLIDRLIPSDCKPQWALLTTTELLCGYLGDERTLEFYRTAVRAYQPLEVETRTLADDISHRVALWQAEGEVTFRAAVPPSRVRAFIADAKVSAPIADPAFGIVIGAATSSDVARIRDAVKAVAGTVTFRRADGTLLDVATRNVEHMILQRLKGAFDPEGKLAPLPGRV